MAAIPNVHIEWEWRGRTIRNMSLMTFGRQMYLIRESSSPTSSDINKNKNNHNDGILSSISQPVNVNMDVESILNIVTTIANEHISTTEPSLSDHQFDLSELLFDDEQILNRSSASIASIPIEPSPESFESSAHVHYSSSSSLKWPLSKEKMAIIDRKKRSINQHQHQFVTSDTFEAYKRTSTLYIMNALEKDSGR